MRQNLTAEQIQAIHKPDWYWRGRSLENYKAMHKKWAADEGKGAALEAAKTLTSARKILFGYKRGNVR